ncbi:hypothetical protein DPMN_137031 [Dreissena polymorpha]|uniref:Uncharacterized protein n=1 Tax=Dreissena polymorpha TaxID=45954 RepID=A0A9D4G126_DREPO|nr:hypothetical protein DPMN_137031 [Dreissena polymorpha]
MMRTRQQNTKTHRSGPGITTTAHSTASPRLIHRSSCQQREQTLKHGTCAHQHKTKKTRSFDQTLRKTRDTNDRELRLLKFVRSHQLTLANSLNAHKPSRTATSNAPYRQLHINKANTRTFPGAEFVSDHG